MMIVTFLMASLLAFVDHSLLPCVLLLYLGVSECLNPVCFFGLFVYCEQLHNFLGFRILKTAVIVLLVLWDTLKLLSLVLILGKDLLRAFVAGINLEKDFFLVQGFKDDSAECKGFDDSHELWKVELFVLYVQPFRRQINQNFA